MIFDHSIKDSYIMQLSYEDTQTLIEEAKAEIRKLEIEISDLVGDIYSPEIGLKPSEISWDPDLYEEEIKARPWVRENMLQAQEISAKVGEILAIEATASLNAQRIEREING